MEYTELTTTFNVGEKVFYPTIGICTVEKEELRGDKTYLKLFSPSQDSVILLPRDNASSLGLRKLTDKESLKKALSILSSKIEAPSFWKERVERNQSLLKEGSVEALCKIISNLYSRQKIKELPTIEKRLYDNALDMLISEAMSVLKKSEEDIRKIIFSYLEDGAEFRFNCNSSRVIS